MNNLGRENSNSLEKKVDLSEIEEKRKHFKFPADFSFNNPDYAREVVELYGRHTFDWDSLPRGARKSARADYREKCIEYLIENKNWPKPFAWAASRAIGLPNHVTEKKVPGKIIDFFADGIAGSLPEKYAAAIADITNEKREVLTKKSIQFDAAELALVAAGAAVLWSNPDSGFLHDVYDYVSTHTNGVGTEGFKWWLTIAAAFRSCEVAYRTKQYLQKKEHTPSPAILFPVNPNLFSGGIMLLAATVDIFGRIKDSYKLASDARIESMKYYGTKRI